MEEEKANWTERMEKVEIGSINEQREKLIERFEKVLEIIKGLDIRRVEDLMYIKKPLDHLESDLKDIPNGPLFFEVLPTEIKDYILSYLCPSNAFIASAVCREWKQSLEKRFKDKEVVIGEECSKCENSDCVKVVDMFTAAAEVRELDTHMVILKSTEVDSKIITDGLTNISRFTFGNRRKIDKSFSDFQKKYLDFETKKKQTEDQLEYLFGNIENGDKIMEEVKLVGLDLRGVNSERLVNCLVNKTKRVSFDLNQDEFNIEIFMTKLLEDPANVKLTHLSLFYFNFPEYLVSEEHDYNLFADALCNVENVKLCGFTALLFYGTMDRLIGNILREPIPLKTLIILITGREEEDMDYFYDFKSLSTQNLTALFNKLTTCRLEGDFTMEQLEAVGYLPDVEVCQQDSYNNNNYIILKGASGLF